MKIFSKFTLLVVACVLMASCAAKKSKPQHPAQKVSGPKQAVEQAHFTTLNGKDVAVSNFKGKVVLIDFWETWCGPCIKSMPTLNKLQQQYPQRLKILAVTPGFSDTIKDTKQFVSKHDYHFTYLMDTNNLHTKLHVTGIPFKVFIDPQGNFITTQKGSYGAKGDFEHIQKIVKKYTQASPQSS